MTITHFIKSAKIVSIAAFGLLFHSQALSAGNETLTIAGGCFWCVESDFESVTGVVEAVSGFTGGHVENPTYKQVSKGGTGHYEAVQITFDPAVVSRDALLAKFFRSIDPTDANGQFCDRGDSYRSAVFYNDPKQKEAALKAKADAGKDLAQPIVTPVLEAVTFYPAGAGHQDYYKGQKIVLTRFGPKRQSAAYKAYREACGRDARVKQLWGEAAAFVGK